MDSNEQFTDEWQKLKAKRQQLIDKGAELAQRLASLPQESQMLALLEEKRKLKMKVPELRLDIQHVSRAIASNHERIERRRRALTDARLQRQLSKKLQERRERLAKFEEMKAPRVIIENERTLVFELEGPIEEVEAFYRRENAETEKKIKAVERLIEESLARIAAIDEHYRSTKRCLKEAIRETEQERLGCRLEEVEWATQSRSHLEWTLEHAPSYKDDIVPRYKVRFPEDQLLDLFPSQAPVVSAPKPSGKKRRDRPSSPRPTVANAPAVTLPAWRFWVTFNANDEGQELPQKKEQFLAQLRVFFEETACPTPPAALVYDKLVAVTRMELAQRQMIKKLAHGEEPDGWKIIRVSREHRLFLSVDEERRHIRFLPCQRKKAYSGH